ncbi:hypothetical protein C1645_818381 [Glomus cerebriforme]|uniref:Uncharacterized protein n=1 Tax=Glomus cerebriforme TaxID=658196 RepID=A0A397TH47_9GLOM|nr:hypothetical protein C1645_818381 [Glomus cerebriforme]
MGSFNGKIKYLSDLGLNEPKGSDALTVDKQIANYLSIIYPIDSNGNSMDRNKEQVNKPFLSVTEVLKQSNYQNVKTTEFNAPVNPLKSNN